MKRHRRALGLAVFLGTTLYTSAIAAAQSAGPLVDVNVGAFGGLSFLGSTATHCAQVASDIARINPALVPTCSFPDRAGSWGVGGGLDITPFAGVAVRYHSIPLLRLTASAPITAGTTAIEQTNEIGPFHQWEVVGIARLALGPVNPYVEGGIGRWELAQSSNFHVAQNGQRLLETSTARTDNAFSPVFGAGLRIQIVPHLTGTVGYERVIVKKGAIFTEHYDEIRAGLTVNVNR